MQIADPVEAARALLPRWVLWGGLIYLPLAFAAAALLASATVLAAHRPVAEAHWTEREPSNHTRVYTSAMSHEKTAPNVIALRATQT